MSPPQKPIEHGTDRGYNAHRRRKNDPPCDACKKAHAEYIRNTQPKRVRLKPIEHGTERGYNAEIRRNLETCEKCRAAHNVYRMLKEHRKKSRQNREAPGGRWQPIKHGTNAGWRSHYRREEKPCDPCRRAHNEYKALRRRERGELIGAHSKWARMSVELFAQMYWTATPEVQDQLDAEIGKERIDRWIKSAEIREEAS